MAYGDPVTVVSSAARTTTGNTSALEPGSDGETISLLVDITAVSGTPSMVVSVEWSNDGSSWAVPEAADAFTALTTAVKRVKSFERKALLYRIVWTISGGTPSLTFSVSEFVTG